MWGDMNLMHYIIFYYSRSTKTVANINKGRETTRGESLNVEFCNNSDKPTKYHFGSHDAISNVTVTLRRWRLVVGGSASALKILAEVFSLAASFCKTCSLSIHGCFSAEILAVS